MTTKLTTVLSTTSIQELINAGVFKSLADVQKLLDKAVNSLSTDDAKTDFALDCFLFMIEQDNAVATKWKTGKVLCKWYPNGYNHLRENKLKMAQVKMKHKQISAGWKQLLELGLVTKHCDTNNVAHTYYYIVEAKMDELLNPVVEEPKPVQELVEVEEIVEQVEVQDEVIERSPGEQAELAALIAEQQADDNDIDDDDAAEIDDLFE